mmetsp:Transcript_22128/g.37761  ORF Transcript_22128/g.37761 Transcript_22128/m.37761 type:complete len:83 (-) Transcript_22128:51-299(-)
MERLYYCNVFSPGMREISAHYTANTYAIILLQFKKGEDILDHNTCTRRDADFFPCSLPTSSCSSDSLPLNQTFLLLIEVGLP